MKRLCSLVLLCLLLLCACTSEPPSVPDPVLPDSAPETSKEPETPSAPTQTPQQEEEEKKAEGPLLYRASDADGDVVWLFGSVHVGEEEMYPFADYITDALLSSDALAMELDPDSLTDQTALAEALAQMVYSDSTTIRDHISPDLYEEAVEILQENELYASVLDYYKPSFWFMEIDSLIFTKLGVTSEYGVETQIAKLAKEQGIPIEAIESIAEQYAMFAGFSEELQEFVLEDAVESYRLPNEVIETEFEDLLDVWKRGDAKDLYALAYSEEALPEEDALAQEYHEAVLVDRNKNMADFAENALEDGREVFICVGAMHVVGEGGIADLLAERGYTVTDARPALSRT